MGLVWRQFANFFASQLGNNKIYTGTRIYQTFVCIILLGQKTHCKDPENPRNINISTILHFLLLAET